MKVIETTIALVVGFVILTGVPYYIGYSLGYRDAANSFEKAASTWIEERLTISSLISEDKSEQIDRKFLDDCLDGFKPFSFTD